MVVLVSRSKLVCFNFHRSLKLTVEAALWSIFSIVSFVTVIALDAMMHLFCTVARE